MQGACKYGFYELFKKKFSDLAGPEAAHQYRTLLYLSASASAEVIADVALCPMEALKVKIQTAPAEKPFATSTMEGIRKIVQSEGISGYESITL